MNLYVNLHSNYGKSESLIREIIENGGLEGERIESIFWENNIVSAKRWCLQQLEEGHYLFVAVGGDGTLNCLLNILMSIGEEYPEYCDLIEMGAIGVGSSNDAHKPFLQRKRPYLRVNRNRLKKIDIGQVEWEYSGQRFQRYFLLNTSIGITSQANHLFNSNELWWLPLLKKISTGLAIHAVALYSLFKNKTYKVDLEIDGARHCWAINNLAVLKRKHFGGGFKFDQEPDLDDGDLMVKANFDLSMMGLFKTALGLTKGYFPRSESNFSQRVKRLHIVHRDNTPLNLEVDGEVFPATQVWWNIHSKAMSVIC